MKKIGFILIFCFSLNVINGQIKEKSQAIDTIIDPIQIEPTYPGGIDSLKCFIASNISVEKFKFQKRPLILMIKIDSSGKPEFYELRSLENGKENNAILKRDLETLIQKMPFWIPAKQQEEKIASMINLPINKKMWENENCR